MSGLFSPLKALAPGLLLAVTIAIAAYFIAEHLGGPVMMLALLIGTAFNFLADDEKCGTGISFSSRIPLRAGIVLLGAAVTLGDLSSLGPAVIGLVIGLVILTLGLGWLVGRACGLSSVHALISAGAVAICGASAAFAIASVLPQSKESERSLLVTIAGVTALSTLAMITYPVLARLSGFDEVMAGIFLGGSIHDVAQVMGAGFIYSDTAGETAVIVKLMRVSLLAPVVVVIGLLHRSPATGQQSPLPLFIIGFIVMVGLNSAGMVPEVLRDGLLQASRFLLVIAVAALGVRTNLRSLATAGSGPIAALLLQTALIAGLAWLGLVLFFQL